MSCFSPKLPEDTDDLTGVKSRGASRSLFTMGAEFAHAVESVEHMAGSVYHMLPPQATAALAAEAAKRGIVLPTDMSSRGLSAAAAASGVIPSKYAAYISSIAAAANIKMPKDMKPESLLSLATSAYHALPEANQSQLSSAIEAHGLIVPKEISPSGLSEAALANGMNPKFFAHQLSTIATTHGFKLPAGLTEDSLAAMTAGVGAVATSYAVKALPEGAGSKLAAVAASRGLKIPTDTSASGLAAAAAASGMLPQEYTNALHAAAAFAKIALPKNASPESLAGLAASAYRALPQATHDQIAAAAEAHHVAIPKDLTPGGLAEAAMAAGMNPKFFAHQLATAAATHGVRLPDEMTEDIVTAEVTGAVADVADKALPEGAGAKIAAVAAARGIKMPTDTSPAGLASAAAASGMAPKDYAHALRHAAKAAKIKVPKNATPESVTALVATAYSQLPEANTTQILAAADAHSIAVPQDLSSAGLAEAAKSAGVNTKFFAHQLATAAASQGYKLPAGLAEGMHAAAQGSAVELEAEQDLEPEAQTQKLEMRAMRAPSGRGAKVRSGTKSKLAGAGVDLADVQVPDADAKGSRPDPAAAAASEEMIRVLSAAHFDTITAKDELIKSQAALIASLQKQVAAADDDKKLIQTQAALIESLQRQLATAAAAPPAAPSTAFEPA